MNAQAKLTPRVIYEQFLSLNLFWLGAALLGLARSGALVGFVPLAISVLVTAMLMAQAEKACMPRRRAGAAQARTLARMSFAGRM